jgi:diguanylate cyclase (GGDEF)-like protein
MEIGIIIVSAVLAIFIIFLTNWSKNKRVRELNDSLNTIEERRRIEREEDQARIREALEGIDEEQRKAQDTSARLTMIRYLASELTSLTSRKEILTRLFQKVEQLLDSAEISYFSLEEDEKTLTLYTSPEVERYLPKAIPKELHIGVGDGYIGFTAQKRVALLKEDFDKESNIIKERLKANLVSGLSTDLAAPLISHGELLGVINLSKLSQRTTDEKAVLQTVADITAISLAKAKLFEEVQNLADTDGLTKLYNKRKFLEFLDLELKEASRYPRTVSLIVLDIDNFKNYNDTNGHPKGDELLKKIGDVLRESIREVDILARYGGEEFCIICPETDKKGALALAGRLRERVAETDFQGGEKQPLGKITISLGVATFPQDKNTLDGLIEAADKALYRAKEGGRDRISAYEKKIFQKIQLFKPQ